VICGEGTDRPFLENLCRELGISDKVEFRGEVREEDLVAMYNSFSLFVLPSHQEGFGFPIIEAQACGVPVLTVKGAMIPEEVMRGTVSCRDIDDMAVWMDRLQNDVREREKVIAEGIAHAKCFSLENMAQMTSSVYEQLSKK